MIRNPAEMNSYASIFPGVAHLPTRKPHTDRFGHAWCIAGCARNGRAVGGDGLCDICRSFSHEPGHRAIAFGHGLVPAECRCGQRIAVQPAAPYVCDTCRSLDRKPQGEAVRLFTPAPAQMPGQLNF